MDAETPIRGPVERLVCRPWRVMAWAGAGPERLAVCVDAQATWSDALAVSQRNPGSWVESVPEFHHVD